MAVQMLMGWYGAEALGRALRVHRVATHFGRFLWAARLETLV